MSELQSHPPARPLADLLERARDHAERGAFMDALNAVRDAKRLQPRNVYILAFERQAELLVELASAGTLGEAERTDILESIPGIVDRALESHASASLPTAPTADAAQAERAQAERRAAHEWLKNQYFQHAHEYVKKGEYDHALAEVRRIFIIDPENAMAHDFERQIGELSLLKKASELVPAPPAKAPPKPSAPPQAKPGAGQKRPAPVPRRAAEPTRAKRKRLRPLSIILLFLALALLAFATVFLIKQMESPAPQTPSTTIPPPEREVFAPDRKAPRSDSSRVPAEPSKAR